MPKASADTSRELARLSTDCSFLLTHMIRQRGTPPKDDAVARATLLSILGLSPGRKPLLKAGPVGWYAAVGGAHSFDPPTASFKTAGACKAVCFTESTLAGLRAHRAVFDVKYALAFDRDWLFSRGAGPCLNVREDLLKADVGVPASEKVPRKAFNYIPSQLHPFINVINDSFDATHEREWRHSGDLDFVASDVRFIFCPEAEFATFSSMQSQGLPTLFDLGWLDRV